MEKEESLIQKSIKGLDLRLKEVMKYALNKNPEHYKNQTLVSKAIGFTRPNLSAALNGDERYLTANLVDKFITEFPELNKIWLLTGKGDMLKVEAVEIPKGELKPKTYSHTLQVRLVTNKAKAGWSDGYYNDEYLEDMPIVTIETDANYKGRYLAFEVSGDSMEPDYMEKDIVICREVQRHLWTSKLHIRDWDFVIAHGTQGIMLKEIAEHNVETGEIVCRSINDKYKDFTLNLKEVAFLYNVVEVRQKGRNKRWNRAKSFLTD